MSSVCKTGLDDCFMSLSTVFKSYGDYGGVIMKGSVQ